MSDARDRSRVPAGIGPRGGQFTPDKAARSSVSLADEGACQVAEAETCIATPTTKTPIHPMLDPFNSTSNKRLDSALRAASQHIAADDYVEAYSALQDVTSEMNDAGDEAYFDARRARARVVEMHNGHRFSVDGKTEFTKALSRIRRDKPRRAIIVWHFNQRKKRDDLPEITVPEGTILTVEVRSGLPDITVASGQVIFRANSRFGNAITALPGSEVHVVTDGQDRKVTVQIEPGNVSKPEPIVTAGPGEQGPESRLHFWHSNHRDLPLDQLRAVKLPEVEHDMWDEPLAWRQP